MLRTMIYLPLLLAPLASLPVQAETLVDTYTAVLSDIDHVNSKGSRLKTAAAVIRQDRANYHRYNQRDLLDEGDRFFANKANRDALEEMLATLDPKHKVIVSIVNGTPTVRISVYKRENGKHSITVGIK